MMTSPASAWLDDYPLQNLNTLGFAARSRYAALIDSEDDLPIALAQAEASSLPVLVLGGGSNLVLTGDFDGLVLVMRIAGRTRLANSADAWHVEAGAGENWHDFVRWTLDQGCPGLENLALIPGTVGAAPVQNIGAYGREVGELFDGARAWDRQTHRFVTLGAADCAFAYRDSLFKRAGRGRYVITRVRLRLPRPWRAHIDYADLAGELASQGIAAPTPQQIFDAVVMVRARKLPDPAVLGNVGSFFHNPVVDAAHHARLRAQYPQLVSYAQADGRYKLAAGWLIDQCGFKGLRDGHVGVHERQALVLVHRGGGTATELLRLAERIREVVMQRFDVHLNIEPEIV